MAGPSMRISVGASLSSLGVPHAAATAMEYAANAFSCRRGARSSIATRQQAPGQLQSLFAQARADREEKRLPGPAALPEGFVPIREARNM